MMDFLLRHQPPAPVDIDSFCHGQPSERAKVCGTRLTWSCTRSM